MTFSIITVVFNGENLIEGTIQSVVNQTYKGIEYLIIDGGSKDGTVDIIKKQAENYPIRWISERDKGRQGHPAGQGLAARRNGTEGLAD